ncbi:hypothetical protein NQ318_018572 [Aromia moschata]|uniref:Uncharacterized protein n=1 Tax=Aromia moschata TaxID=1265417 RepID=A0AAV8ZIF6_9CUCU|nr:hypothetical protein NQ318_018572 [Aromia moschata]
MDTNPGTLNVSGTLDISKVDIPEIPKDIIFPDELNRYLREQIRYYVHENGMLQKNLSDVELKYNDCKVKTNNLHQILNSFLVPMKEEKPPNELEETIKKLQEKVNSASNKLLEVRNWLQQEVGETFESLQSLSNSGNSNWRGRAQIVCDLQQKNNELREKLKDLQEKCNSSTAAAAIKTDNRIAALTKEINEMKQNYEDLKKKYDASRARCRVLDTDYNLLKSKFTMLKEQSYRDQDIISTLSAQISNTRETKNDILRQRDEIMNRMRKEKEILVKELGEYKMIVKNLRGELKDKQQEVENVKSSHSFDGGVHVFKPIDRAGIPFQNPTDAKIRKQRSAKAEANAARMALESNTSKGGSYSTPSIRPLEFGLKDQLELAEENIKALKTRLEIEQYERKTDLQEFSRIIQQKENDEKCETDKKSQKFTNPGPSVYVPFAYDDFKSFFAYRRKAIEAITSHPIGKL